MSSSDYHLHPDLAADTLPVGDLTLSSVLLMDDARFPWLILVPRVAAASEIVDLSDEDAVTLMREIRIATGVMQAIAKPDKINVGLLGNVVAQLHVHIVGRFRSDPAWPGPVWGAGTRMRYPAHAAAELSERAASLFAAA